MAIQSFSDEDTGAFWRGVQVIRFVPFQAVAIRKLQMLNTATALTDIGRVPGNRLEALKGDRKGQHSIRINDKWRVCFRWTPPDALQVEITNHYD